MGSRCRARLLPRLRRAQAQPARTTSAPQLRRQPRRHQHPGGLAWRKPAPQEIGPRTPYKESRDHEHRPDRNCRPDHRSHQRYRQGHRLRLGRPGRSRAGGRPQYSTRRGRRDVAARQRRKSRLHRRGPGQLGLSPRAGPPSHRARRRALDILVNNAAIFPWAPRRPWPRTISTPCSRSTSRCRSCRTAGEGSPGVSLPQASETPAAGSLTLSPGNGSPGCGILVWDLVMRR